MKTLLTAFTLCILSLSATAQSKTDKQAAAIEKEGKALYRSEICSWNGTDILLEKLGDRKKEVGGYFSYADGDSMRFIFTTRGLQPGVLASLAFDSTCAPDHAVVYMSKRDFTPYEKELYMIRTAVGRDLTYDTMYRSYKNTELNVIPVIDGKTYKAYILTGPNDNGVIIFGNDYEITLDKNGDIKSRRKIHHDILIEQFDGTKNIEAGIHTHLPSTGEMITATDICTLMLYEKLVKYKQYIVMSDKYVSLWDCTKDHLLVLTKEAWDRIYEDQKKRHPSSEQESK